ncbi:MAG: transglutaminase family protein, partial [Phycisphaerae bacterium]
MLLRTTHKTRLSYSSLIGETVMELRMAPRHERNQHRLAFDLAVGPATEVRSYFDWLGNTVHVFSIGGFHDAIEIVATSVVQTTARPGLIEKLADLFPLGPLDDYALAEYLRFDTLVCDSPALTDFAHKLRPRGEVRLAEVVGQIMAAINRDFTYQAGVTTVASPVTEMLGHGRGVCQDFAHLMIATLRKLGVPARYVSGYIHAGRQSYRGAAQSHAWCEVYFPSAGWLPFDPTNNCMVGEYFVKVGLGRSYRDVPPHKGVFRGFADESIAVEVLTEELPEVSNRSVGERFTPLGIPVYRHSARGA